MLCFTATAAGFSRYSDFSATGFLNQQLLSLSEEAYCRWIRIRAPFANSQRHDSGVQKIVKVEALAVRLGRLSAIGAGFNHPGVTVTDDGKPVSASDRVPPVRGKTNVPRQLNALSPGAEMSSCVTE